MSRKKKILIGVTAAILAAPLATAYHIDPMSIPSFETLTAGDWTLAIPFFIICESNPDAGTDGTVTMQNQDGPFPTPATSNADLSNDDRNTVGDGRPGNGGLCTTGRNDAAGALGTMSGGGGVPDITEWTRLDACQKTIDERGPVSITRPVAGPCTGSTTIAGVAVPDTHGISWDAEIGVYGCFIPGTMDLSVGGGDGDTRDTVVSGGNSRVERIAGISATHDFALYYREAYAWLTFDGDGSYTVGNAAGDQHNELARQQNQDANDIDEGTADSTNNHARADATYGADNVDAWHGHVAMFIDQANSAIPEDTQGSAYAEDMGDITTDPDFNELRDGPDRSGAAPGTPDDGFQGTNPIIGTEDPGAAGPVDGNAKFGLGGMSNDCGGSPTGQGQVTTEECDEAPVGTDDCVTGWDEDEDGIWEGDFDNVDVNGVAAQPIGPVFRAPRLCFVDGTNQHATWAAMGPEGCRNDF